MSPHSTHTRHACMYINGKIDIFLSSFDRLSLFSECGILLECSIHSSLRFFFPYFVCHIFSVLTCMFPCCCRCRSHRLSLNFSIDIFSVALSVVTIVFADILIRFATFNIILIVMCMFAWCMHKASTILRNVVCHTSGKQCKPI